MPPLPPLFLDTTIQVDRIVAEMVPDKRAAITALLRDFDILMACSYSRLEFKRVVIQNLALALRYLVDTGSFFLALERATRLRKSRRGMTLVNILRWVGQKTDKKIQVDIGEPTDVKLAQQAESYIRNGIRSIWGRFDKSVDSVANRTGCKRAVEPPTLLPSGEIDASIPESACNKKECNNANFFRSQLPKIRALCETLEKIKREGKTLTEELETALKVLRQCEKNADALYDYQKCLDVGDVWIHLESVAAGVRYFATTNYKESQVLCPALGLEMKLPPSA